MQYLPIRGMVATALVWLQFLPVFLSFFIKFYSQAKINLAKINDRTFTLFLFSKINWKK